MMPVSASIGFFVSAVLIAEKEDERDDQGD